MKNYQKDSGEKNVKAPKSCWVWLIEAKEKIMMYKQMSLKWLMWIWISKTFPFDTGSKGHSDVTEATGSYF